MTKIKFLVDYRGKLTGEQFYLAGAVADVEDAAAAELVERNRAELVPVAHPKFRKTEKKDHE